MALDVGQARQAEHTPLPWKVSQGPEDWNRNVYSDAPGIVGNIICDPPEGFQDSMAQWPANAEFIVRACNSHYDLLAACKGLLKSALQWSGDQEEWKAVEAAIARAEGREPVAVEEARGDQMEGERFDGLS